MTRYGVALVHTTSAALRAEKLLKTAGLVVKLIPTPRQFSSDCGMSVRFEWVAVDRVRTLLEGGRRGDRRAPRVAVSMPWNPLEARAGVHESPSKDAPAGRAHYPASSRSWARSSTP